jgi:hypothetical protein
VPPGSFPKAEQQKTLLTNLTVREYLYGSS